MFSELYPLVVELIGDLPPELEFVYGLAVIVLFVFIVCVVFLPYYLLYKLWS